MSVFNTLKLVRNMREATSFSRDKRDVVISYEGYVKSFTEILKKHPLTNENNKKYFTQMDLTVSGFGGEKDIKIVKSGYVFGLLKQIASNSLEDVHTFYEVAQKTVLSPVRKNQINNKSPFDTAHQWYKKSLTAMWLSHPNSPEKLNYWKDLSEEQQENAMLLAVEAYGIPAYKNILEKIKVENLNEKIIKSFLSSKIHIGGLIDDKINKIQEVVSYSLEQKTPIDYSVLSEMLHPSKINLYILSAYLNKATEAFDISKISFSKEKVNQLKSFTLSVDEEGLKIKDFYDIFNTLNWLKKEANKKDNKPTTDSSFLTYMSAPDIFSTIHKKVVYENLKNLVNKEKEDVFNSSKKSKEEKDFWLNTALNLNLVDKPHSRKSKI